MPPQSAPTPRTTRPLTPTHPASPVERAAVTAPLPPAGRVTPRLSQPAPRAIPRFAVGEVVSHPRTHQIGRIGGPPRPWSTALKWPVHWLRNVRGKLCWTHWYTEVWQGELESIQ